MRRKGAWIVAGLVLALLIAGGVWAWRRFAPYPQVGGVYIAQQMCACVFVAGRSEAGCRAEFQPDIKNFKVTLARSGPDRGLVQTRMLLFRAASRFERGYGCTIIR